MSHFKIIIVGAGASGIAAAAKLLENGFSDFRILEAEDRIGGRVNTKTFGDFSLELGAEWIHGERGNVVYELASQFDLADTTSSTPSIFLNTDFYDLSGSKITKDLSLTFTTVYYEIMKAVEDAHSSEILKSSIGSYFEDEFSKAVEKLNIDKDLSMKFLKTFENWENSIDASHSWHETSLSGHLEYWECDGNILTLWKNNRYSTIFDLLTKKIPNPANQLPVDSKIIFGKEVVKVIWNKECKLGLPNVRVECLDGTVYFADKILLTCSIGVLKERALSMFYPSLPRGKLSCIENLGFGTVDKIFVKFEHQWWKEDIDGFAFLWSEAERKNDTTGWLNGVICFHPINSKSTILRGWITGEAARVMESLSDNEILKGLNYLFDKFLGSSLKVPPIGFCITSKWYSNPHFRGSYSCRLMKSEAADVWASQLAETVNNDFGQGVLYFGGEATHDHYFSTVHGAIEAGQREAKKLLPTVIESSQTEKQAQVTIIGAGISGLAAAKTLLENGVSDVIILEAQSEPGGRIRSVKTDGYFLEIGAQWIHGEKNEVFTFCQENNLLTDEYSSEGEGIYFRENGEHIDERLVREVDDVVKDIFENCETYILSQEKIDRSIGEELSMKFNEYLDSCSQDSAEIKKIKRELLDWHVRFLLIDNSCSDLFNLSAKAWGLFKFCDGNEYINFKNGYSSLINALVNCIPGNVLRLETPVRRIDWVEELNTSKKRAKVTTTNGVVVYSDYVIVTCSLGYLKRNYKTMFCPPLPKYITEAIELLDFGVIDKIFLIYEKPWWDSKMKGFQLVWSNDLSDESDQHWVRYMTGFDVIMKDKPVLLGWIGGEGAKTMEQIPEEVVGREVTETLQKFTKNFDIPFPKKIIRTKWWCNEYVKGAYSHITVKCDESEICCSNLAQPVYTTIQSGTQKLKKPTILLAGESTHKSHFSTVHGAYESGQNQARVILEDIKSINKEL